LEIVLEVRGVSNCEKPLSGDVRRQGLAVIHAGFFRPAAEPTTLFGSYLSARACFYTVLCEIRVWQPAVAGFERRDLLIAITMAQPRYANTLPVARAPFEAKFRTLAGH
jgi:hypothetical protein